MKYALFILSTLFLSHAYSAGHKTNNGGGGMVCLKDGQKSVELLDFWEARTLKGMQIPHLTGAQFEQQKLLAYDRFKKLPSFYPHSEYIINSTQIEILQAGIKIEAPDDAKNAFVQKGCHIEGIASFDDFTNSLYLDIENSSALSPTDNQGLLMHEAVYKLLRDQYEVSDSIAARNITACLFSTEPCPELNARYEIPTEGPLLKCASEKRHTAFPVPYPLFYVFPHETNPLRTGPSIRGKQGLWRFQIVSRELNQRPISRAYFDVHLDMPEASVGDNIIYPDFVHSRPNLKGWEEPVHFISKTSENRWRNLGPHFDYTFASSLDQKTNKTTLTIQGERIICQRIR